MSFSNFLELEFLDHLTKKGAYTPGAIYIGLSTVATSDDGTLTEPNTAANYDREITSGDSWSAASGGATENAVAVTFNEASSSWGTVTNFFLADSLAGGNMLGHGTLNESKAIGVGDTPRFAAGDFDMTLD